MKKQGWAATAALAIAMAGCQNPRGVTRPVNRNISQVANFGSLDSFLGDVSRSDSGDLKRDTLQAKDSLPKLPKAAGRKQSPALSLPAEQETDATALGSLPLTLDNAIAVSLDRNPNLITMRAGEPVAQTAYGVSEVYPWNPFVQVHVLPYAHDQAGSALAVQHYVWVMQTIELAHQGQHRRESASAALNQVRWNIVQAELTTAAQTERLYFTALFQRDLRDLARRGASLNAELLGVVERRFKAGLATATEQTTAKVAVRQSQRQAELAEANFQTALIALQRQLNLPANEKIALTGRLTDFSWLPVGGAMSSENGDSLAIPGSNSYVAELARQRPDVLAAQSGVGVAQANADLARANQCQNVAIGPFYERDETGTVFAGFRTQMNLPVWDSGRPLTAQREAEQNLQCVTFDQLRSRAESEAGTAIERYERARRFLEKEQANREQNSTEELQNIQKQFTSGQADILNVFNVQTTLLQEQSIYFGLLNEVAQAAADVTLMAGLPPARVVTAKGEIDSVVVPEPKGLPTP